LFLPLAEPVLASEFEPRESADLTQTHLEFRWEPVCFAQEYQLTVVRDDGSDDPFDGTSPVVDETVRGFEPRAVIRSGLAFGEDYAWRVRGGHPQTRGRWRSVPSADAWGPTHRFTIRALPDNLPAWSVSEPEPGPVESGLTILDMIAFPFDTAGQRAVAVDRAGAPVWFNRPASQSFDTRQLRDGLISYLNGRVFVTNLRDEVVWSSPEDPTLVVHHEAFPMPNGNFLAVVWDDREVEIGGEVQQIRGDRIVEFERETRDVVWEWSTFDHYSLDDMPPGEIDNGNWTHVNAVVYDPRDRTVTISSRNLSRLTRIDYDSGEIIFNMGKQMTSGDVDFGEGLFRVQHAPEVLRNGNILLHDNGTLIDPVNNVSRAVEIELDHPSHPTSASVVWEYVLPRFSPVIGDADRLPNGNTLIASGIPSGLLGGATYEVTPEGALVWSLEVEAPFFFYRAERIQELVVRSRRQRLEGFFEAVRHHVGCRFERRRAHAPRRSGKKPSRGR